MSTDVAGAFPLTVPFPNACAADRAIIVVGSGARICLLEHYLPGCVPWNAVDIFLEEGADVEYVSLADFPAKETTKILRHARVGQGASIAWRMASLSGDDVEHEVVSDVLGENGKSTIDWLCMAGAGERLLLTARNVFHARNGGGEITMRGAAWGDAHVSARGGIAIGPSGAGTNTYLTQQMLMLDSTAKVDAVPALEIKTNDVRASHSATVSRVSPDDLFYFAARGVTEREARGMYVRGFLRELVAKIGDPGARERVERAIERALKRKGDAL